MLAVDLRRQETKKANSSGGPHSGADIRLMDKILHDPTDPKLWELWYIPYYGSCRILSINRSSCKQGYTASEAGLPAVLLDEGMEPRRNCCAGMFVIGRHRFEPKGPSTIIGT